MKLALLLIPVLPLAGAAINGLLGRHLSHALVRAVALLLTGASFVLALWVAWRVAELPQERVPHIESYATWIRAGGLSADFAFYLDQLSLVMLLVVTGVGFLIHIYAVGYMEHEGGYYRFFSYMNLFMFFMLVLVMANNYPLMFVGWEGVGLCSYLLIGFFFTRDSAANAGKKAFIVNRIGDFAFLIGLFLLFRQFGSLNYDHILRAASALPVEETGAGVLTAVCLLLLVGACGKSALVPLYVWLPDAMEGPTPVSALIHAATMVTAGVYMVARSSPLYSRAPYALLAVAIIGIITAILAAVIALAQHDIKRVLAYSTISQLGYMFLACGVAAYSAAIFHLMTHAFFKALLFLAAGSVIHALAGEQDMRRMGGLRPHIRWTFWTMTAAVFAIAGAPFLSGFFSKDQILWKAWSSPHGSAWFWGLGVGTALLTSFYMFRLWFLTFFGEYRGARAHAETPGREQHTGEADAHVAQPPSAVHKIQESPWIMLGPLVVLAVLSVIGGYIGVPHALGGHNQFDEFLAAPVFKVSAEAMPAHAVPGHGPEATEAAAHAEQRMEWLLTGISVLVALIGFGLAWLFYYRRPELPARTATRAGGLYRAVSNKFYIDELYGAVFVRPLVAASTYLLWRRIDARAIDGTVDATALGARDVSNTVRRMQSGNIRSYAGWVAAGAALVIAYMVWTGTR
jgi:NADH-quinone oxidoreductase subunit L